MMVTFSIGVSILAMWAGLHFIIGTFFAGLLLNEAMGDDPLGEGHERPLGDDLRLLRPPPLRLHRSRVHGGGAGRRDGVVRGPTDRRHRR